MTKKILKYCFMVLLILVAFAVLLVGPWPAYGPSDITQSARFQAAVNAVQASADQTAVTASPDRLTAGWGKGSIIPRVGIPLAGYGDRGGAPSTGVLDELFAKALVLSDGADTVAIVGSGMLIVPENIAEMVRARVEAEAGIPGSHILFNASHTHSGPGGFGPGLMAKMFMGDYDPAIPEAIADGFVKAISDAAADMQPASMAAGRAEAPELIKNRSRDAAVDPGLQWMIVQREDGRRCVVVRYSAHSTVLSGDNMQFSGDYPGYLQQALEAADPETFALFLAGAMGSMSPRAPEGANAFARAEAMGEALAAAVMEDSAEPSFETHVDIANAAAGFTTPSFQLRLTQSLRLSPFLPRLAGIDDDAWIHGLRIGDQFFYGTPADFSGEIGVELEAWARERDLALWVLSFNGDYIGYISPDRYYSRSTPDGRDSYEMYVMSWFGPDQEAWFTQLLKHLVQELEPAA